MKKIRFTLLLLGLYGAAMAQEMFPPSPTAMVAPQVTSPSVEAYAITKFGDIPINEYNGMVNAAIPLYTLKSGQLSLPISLNYNAAGVKVSQPATWTGINWTLNAGGVITRSVHDKADETEYLDGRMTGDTIVPGGLLNGSMYGAWLNAVFGKKRDLWDMKPDQFYFNFPGYSGSFFLDKEFIPRLTKAENNLRIEITGSNPNLKARLRQSNEFCLITPEGVRYYFGGVNGLETSFLGNRTDNPHVPTAYYLTRIEHPVDGMITFEYSTDNVNRNIRLDTDEKVTVKLWERDTDHRECFRPPTVEMQHDITTAYNIIANGKTLSKIKGNLDMTEIVFNSVPGSNQHYRKILNSIDVKESNSVLTTINLSYFFPATPTTSERFFLTKVEFNKNKNYGSGRKYEQYELEYYEPQLLPGRDSQSKDVRGYYNGKENTTALPQNQDLFFHNYYSNLADRSSDYSSAVKGALKRIIYPTKGYTKFEYEMVKAKEYDYGTSGVKMNIWRNNPSRNPATKTTVTDFIGGELSIINGVEHISTVYMDQTVKGIANILANNQMGHTDVMVLKVTDKIDNTVQQFSFRMPDGNQQQGTGSFNFSVEFSFDIKQGHWYTLQLSNNYQFSDTQFECEVYFNYIKGFKLIDDGPLRISRVTDYTAEAGSAFVKRYYYTSLADIFKDPITLARFKSNYSYVNYWQLMKCCNGGGEGSLEHTQQFEINFATLSSQLMIPQYLLEGRYEEVIVSYGGDNFELGGKYKRFNNTPMHGNVGIHTLESSVFQQERASYLGNVSDIYNGTLEEEADLIKRGNTLAMVRQQLYDYKYEDIAGISGVIGGYAYYNCLFPAAGVDNLDLGKYWLLSKKKQLIQHKTIEYMTSPQQSFTTTQQYEYGALIGLPTLIRTTTSEDNVVRWELNTYADQPTLVPDATPTQIAAMNKLVELNKVSEPMMVRTVVGQNLFMGTRTGTKVTLYKSWNNRPDWILPETIRFSKGNDPLEDRISIEKYGPYGQMAKVRLKDGSYTYYQYNYRNQLQVKIENFNPGWNDEVVIPFPVEGSPCVISQSFPGAIVTRYFYDNVTQLLSRAIDTNCRSTFYEYDNLLRLKRIKDHDGNTVEEYDNNYRTN